MKWDCGEQKSGYYGTATLRKFHHLSVSMGQTPIVHYQFQHPDITLSDVVTADNKAYNIEENPHHMVGNARCHTVFMVMVWETRKRRHQAAILNLNSF